MTLLSEIVGGIPQILSISGFTDISIEGVAIDSRKVKSGFLFAAVSGTSADGHDYIFSAIENGAKAIICEKVPDHHDDNLCWICVKDSVTAIAEFSKLFFGDPAKSMKIVGITGTNGKTTIATMCWQLAGFLSIKAGLFSTVDVRIGNEIKPATHTTPDVIQLYSTLKSMRDSGCRLVFMEVSSHALHQKRVHGLRFDIGVFTNITREHLDYHGDFQAYLNAKKILFDELDKNAAALVCIDDKHSKYMIQSSSANVVTYGLNSGADYTGRVIENSIQGLVMRYKGVDIAFKLIGRYNAQNLLAVFGIMSELGIPSEEIPEKWSLLSGPNGRMEIFYGPKGSTGIVDYAHTPDALENLLKNINEMKQKSQSIITVIGCGGNRDKGKRPIMASVTINFSDMIVMTADNPRFEQVDDILMDMYNGIPEGKRNKAFRIADREEGIKMACQLAQPGDIIVVAGKGHETYQEIKGEKFPFYDKKVLQQYLK